VAPIDARKPIPRPRRRPRAPFLLLLAGGGIVAVLGYASWQNAAVEARLRTAERDRAHALAERIVQRAVGSRAAFDAAPPALRAHVLANGDVDARDVGWIEPVQSAVDVDLVVDDRIERATVAEFGPRVAAAAARAYDELLAAPLVAPVRLRALAAAAWQAARAGDAERRTRLERELAEACGAVAPADLARTPVAAAVASALRLAVRDGGAAPAPVAALAPFLPPELLAGLPADAERQAANAAVAARRATLVAIASARERFPPAAAAVVPAFVQRVLWWLPAAGGGHDAALLTPAAWVDCIERAGRDGALPELPAPFRLAPAADTSGTFAGVPGVAGVVEDDTGRQPPWLRPALTAGLLAALLAALGVAVAAQLRAARRETRAARTQSEFLTTVTHELKTPLASIRLLGEMLLDGRARGREPDYYRMLAGEAGRLSMLIENVLDLGRLERGERVHDARPIDAGEAVAETLAMWAPLAERDGVAVAWVDRAGGATVRADRGALVQALVAVLDNARKYAGAGCRVELVTRAVEGVLAIDVRDHGTGVPVADRERIFERFVRGSAHAHGAVPGVGIGLYLARAIARRAGGDLECGDPLDGGPGARFTFRLPLADAPAGAP
jgi:signal transduction histidine kinase